MGNNGEGRENKRRSGRSKSGNNYVKYRSSFAPVRVFLARERVSYKIEPATHKVNRLSTDYQTLI